MNAGGCNPWFNISNPIPVNHSIGGLNDTFLVVLNPLDSNLVFDLYHNGASCGGSTYSNLQWFKNGIPIAGNTQCINAGAGIYQFTCTFDGTESLNITIIVTAVAGVATGVRESQVVSGIHLFPNPSVTGLFNIENEKTVNTYSVSIYNSTGQFIKQQVFTKQNGVLDLSDYKKGIYFIEFIFENGKKNRQKIIYD